MAAQMAAQMPTSQQQQQQQMASTTGQQYNQQQLLSNNGENTYSGNQQHEQQQQHHQQSAYQPTRSSNLSNIEPLLENTGPLSTAAPPPPPSKSQTTMDINQNTSNLSYGNHHDTTNIYSNQQFNSDHPSVGGVTMDNEDSYAFAEPEPAFSNSLRGINSRYQIFLDKVAPHWKGRWTFSLSILALFMLRVVISQGWYVVCYALAIYYLNLLIGFISPKVDPSLYASEDDDDAGPMLPTRANDEFKPFIRRLPEFKFWYSGTKATLFAGFLSLFRIFDVPVFWPILLIYFIILFACTMRQQIKHMIKYSYVPWDSGKKRYTAQKETSSNLFPTTV